MRAGTSRVRSRQRLRSPLTLMLTVALVATVLVAPSAVLDGLRRVDAAGPVGRDRVGRRVVGVGRRADGVVLGGGLGMMLVFAVATVATTA